MALHTHLILPVLLLGLSLSAPYVAGQTATSTTATASRTYDPGNVQGLRACFGAGSICKVKLDLHDQCEEQQEAQGDDGYYECVCGSGYAAVDEACDNCRLVYGMITSRLWNYTATCSSEGYTVAPIPSSVLAQQSSHNATFALGTGATAVEPLTDPVTIQGSPTEPLPTVATTFSLPLQTGAAARRLPQSWILAGLAMAHVLLGIRQ
ncbi:hypothetical protein N657DRAFT_650067 [Parathielavia appendiculata]|uniref:Uncharacterized protein n=1 Tax=Parathielavia appendiculata TaxID=2587402 RepID=A0AAN6YZ75_9PEZI|nr:hypothetical protein N657DRAFT_650067 [Parathielavia appendiculata]